MTTLVRSRRLMPAILAAALVSSVIAVTHHTLAAQARDRTTAGGGTGVIRGRVLAADTSARLGRARVRLVSIPSRQTVMQLADARGQFEFRDLAPGKYSLVATKGGYSQAQYGQRRAFAPGLPIDLADRQTLDGMDIRLPPGATIDGRVFDEIGEPLADAVVMTVRSQYAGGRKRLVNVGRMLTTNERGEFHLFGLPPGTYYLSATLVNANASDAAGREGYAPTYYPGTVDVAAAEAITIGEGEQRAGIDVILNLVRTANLSGTARDADGRPFGSGTVTLVNTVSGVPIPLATGAIAPDGSFRLANIPPGNFTVHASSTAATSGGAKEVATQPVSVNGEDVMGLTLVAPRPAALSGIVAREAADTEPLPAAIQLRVLSANPAEDLTDTGTVIRTNADGTFQATARPGAVRIELAGAPPGWHLSRVLLGENDVTDSGVRLSSSRATEAMRVLLTRRATTVTGTVVDSHDDPVAEYAAIVFAKDSHLWGYRSRFIGGARPDQRGTFSIRGLPPGEYLAAAVDVIEQGELMDPEFLDTIRGAARTIRLGDGEASQVRLPLTRRP